jgi:hypothetical protein
VEAAGDDVGEVFGEGCGEADPRPKPRQGVLDTGAICLLNVSVEGGKKLPAGAIPQFLRKGKTHLHPVLPVEVV